MSQEPYRLATPHKVVDAARIELASLNPQTETFTGLLGFDSSAGQTKNWYPSVPTDPVGKLLPVPEARPC